MCEWPKTTASASGKRARIRSRRPFEGPASGITPSTTPSSSRQMLSGSSSRSSALSTLPGTAATGPRSRRSSSTECWLKSPAWTIRSAALSRSRHGFARTRVAPAGAPSDLRAPRGRWVSAISASLNGLRLAPPRSARAPSRGPGRPVLSAGACRACARDRRTSRRGADAGALRPRSSRNRPRRAPRWSARAGPAAAPRCSARASSPRSGGYSDSERGLGAALPVLGAALLHRALALREGLPKPLAELARPLPPGSLADLHRLLAGALEVARESRSQEGEHEENETEGDHCSDQHGRVTGSPEATLLNRAFLDGSASV